MNAAFEAYIEHLEAMAARPARTFPLGETAPFIQRSADGNGVFAWFKGIDYERIVDAWVLSADRVIPTLHDGRERLGRVDSDAARQWIARVDPRDVRCVADHDGVEGEVGTWFEFRLIGNLLRGRL